MIPLGRVGWLHEILNDALERDEALRYVTLLGTI